MKNYEKYKDKLLNMSRNNECTGSEFCYLMQIKYSEFSAELFIEWLYSDCDILDKSEKEYLSHVTKPFKKEIIGIMKCGAGDMEYIEISMKKYGFKLTFPMFKKGRMYKGMKQYIPYTLQELGL